MNARYLTRAAALACMLSLVGCISAPPANGGSRFYQQRNLVADTAAANAENVDTLFFAAAPDDETHGLYGRLDVAPETAHSAADNLE